MEGLLSTATWPLKLAALTIIKLCKCTSFGNNNFANIEVIQSTLVISKLKGP